MQDQDPYNLLAFVAMLSPLMLFVVAMLVRLFATERSEDDDARERAQAIADDIKDRERAARHVEAMRAIAQDIRNERRARKTR